MKKIIQVISLSLLLAIAAFAQLPPNPNCTKGHIDSPGVICTAGRANSETGNDVKIASEDSILTVIRMFITKVNPLVYFVI